MKNLQTYEQFLNESRNLSPKELSDDELEDELRKIGFGRISPQNQKRYKELHDEFERRSKLKNKSK
jgi:hypothetical protein